LYLLHATVLLEMNRLLYARLVAAIGAFVVAVLLAVATHILIETPTDRLRKRLRIRSCQAKHASSRVRS
jgi:peptidoglycan/LPS O-acetylase OafA/YrhL